MKTTRWAAGTLAGIALAVAPISAVSPAQAAPAATGQPSQATAQAASRCLIWWSTGAVAGDQYWGNTAGYSWAFNVYVSQGASGNRVKEIQCLLDYLGFHDGALDGIFGRDTRRSVVGFQQVVGLRADGIVGPATWRALRGQ